MIYHFCHWSTGTSTSPLYVFSGTNTGTMSRCEVH